MLYLNHIALRDMILSYLQVIPGEIFHESSKKRLRKQTALTGFEPVNAGVKFLCLTVWRKSYVDRKANYY